ncbi:MAG: ubiquitin-like protein Pup [Actinomycetaceae bacterium]|nr:ubiquitin-like protein Pup [Arcanobacterium sp.]MDD7686533.1 ubiquitin-like protein Pup [Actinomycetaceae bacterium]MDY5272813.1 ubiquitin-like protein Pup [Arcanobacterium sp.]
MAERERIQPQRHEEERLEELAQPQQRDENFNVDELLDDIDTILETNASAFVQGFVQKGGQ